MQRLLFALVALISLLFVNIRPMQAQSTSSPAAEQPATSDVKEQAPSAHVEEDAPSDRVPEGAVYVRPDETVENVTVHGKPLVIEGNVTHDVHAVDSDVTIRPGARIGGRLDVRGGKVDIAPGLVLTPDADAPVVTAPLAVSAAPAVPHKQKDWFGGQVALLMLGVVGGVVILMVAPRAAHQVATQVTQEPARCLVVGGLGAVGILFVLLVNAGLMHSIVKYFWAPIGFVVALAPALLLAFGWLCSMRLAGDLVARRVAHIHTSGRLYTRMALGLVSFFLLNVVLGSLSPWLGGVGLLIEFLVALMGLGAVLITGFGADPDWLSRRLHGESRWFSWGRKP
jgi:uncharacterized protein YjeT (DUF2065 family)